MEMINQLQMNVLTMSSACLSALRWITEGSPVCRSAAVDAAARHLHRAVTDPGSDVSGLINIKHETILHRHLEGLKKNNDSCFLFKKKSLFTNVFEYFVKYK